MDYEKNKDALAIVKQMVADGQVAQDVAEKYFPELKESEDEKIRRRLSECLNNMWLLGNNMDYSEYSKEEVESWLAWLEQKGEQNPAFEMKTPEESLGIDSDTYNKIVDECIYGDDKSTWSKEDEERLQSCLNILQAKGFMGATDTINTKWLKSLKDRVQPKPSWSEEDRRMLIGLMDELDAIMNKATPNEISVYSKYTNWLKSLRPQNTWKPSEEQMEAVETAINVIGKGTLNGGQLTELLEQLKAL